MQLHKHRQYVRQECKMWSANEYNFKQKNVAKLLKLSHKIVSNLWLGKQIKHVSDDSLLI